MRKNPWTQAAALTVLFSLLVQSLGAADLALIMRQPAMPFFPPPAAAARLLAYPKPAFPAPAAKPAPPRGPSFWTRLGTGAGSWGSRLLAWGKTSSRKAAAAWSELWAVPEPEPIKPVDLDIAAPAPPVLPVLREEPAAVSAPAAPPAQDRMLIVSEPSPAPAPAAPAAATPPAPRNVIQVQPQPVNDRRNLFRYPRLRPVAWFTNFGSRRGAQAGSREEPASRSVMPRLDGRWQEGRGLRYRVNYLNPRGFSRAGSRGVEYLQPGRRLLNRGEVLPRKLWDTYAIYAHGDTVDYEIEVENTSDQPLRDVEVVAAEEVLSRSGGAGAALGPARALRLEGGLAPGRTARLRDSFPITINWVFQGSFEQTHVKVSARAGTETQPTVRGEAYQAGVIDPPPED